MGCVIVVVLGVMCFAPKLMRSGSAFLPLRSLLSGYAFPPLHRAMRAVAFSIQLATQPLRRQSQAAVEQLLPPKVATP